MRENDDLPPPTAPPNFPVAACGFETTEHAERFATTIGHMVYFLSSYIELDRLDGITVAHDYDKALAQLDRGYKSESPLKRTLSGNTIGLAMAPAVLRDGVVKGHLVFFAPAVLPIENKSVDDFREAFYIIAHECAHIEDLKHRDERFPGTILQKKITDAEDTILEKTSGAIWEEYAACRISAIFGKEITSFYEENLIGVLQNAFIDSNKAILSYRSHRDLNRVLEEAGYSLCEPLRLMAYLMGHLDGLGKSFSATPSARDELLRSNYNCFSDRLKSILCQLWTSRSSWESPAVFNPIKDIVRDVFRNGGVNLCRQPDGRLYVGIPFTPETTPE